MTLEPPLHGLLWPDGTVTDISASPVDRDGAEPIDVCELDMTTSWPETLYLHPDGVVRDTRP